MCTFLGLLPRERILPGAKFTSRPSLAFSYIGSVTAQETAKHRAKFGWLPVSDVAAVRKA